jgi:hypothetical protein
VDVSPRAQACGPQKEDGPTATRLSGLTNVEAEESSEKAHTQFERRGFAFSFDGNRTFW